MYQAIETSRPGFWVITIWCYIVGVHGRVFELTQNIEFWLGFVYVTFPLNFMVYAMNDYGDEKIDKLNPRKGIFLFGGNGIDRHILRKMISFGIVLNCIYLYALGYIANIDWYTLSGLFGCLFLTNYIYNFGPTWRQGPMPLDLIGPLGFVGLIPLASALNHVPQVSFGTLLYHSIMILRSQLWGQIFDVEYDARHNRKTTAVTLGVLHSRVALVLFVCLELVCALVYFDDRYVQSFSALSVLQALFDLTYLQNTPPSLKHAAIPGVVLTSSATLLLVYISSHDAFP